MSPQALAAVGMGDSQQQGYAQPMEDVEATQQDDAPRPPRGPGDDVRGKILAEVKNYLPAEIRRKVINSMGEYALNIESFLKCNDIIQNIQEDITALKKGLTPNGMRKFSLPLICNEMDDIISPDTDLTITITIERGVRFRQAKEQAQMELLATQKFLDKAVLERQSIDLKESTDFKRFASAREAPYAIEKQIMSLNLDVPDEIFPPTRPCQNPWLLHSTDNCGGNWQPTGPKNKVKINIGQRREEHYRGGSVYEPEGAIRTRGRTGHRRVHDR
mmetsp:Transcript_89155/g.252659  ORF Transcript_89155/g.252659 Transcript_89155/m.252659 type:complete len:274 (-) Transcript_89155:651-1472(-)